MPKPVFWVRVGQLLQQQSRLLITSSAVAGCVIILRFAGLLQSLELGTLDQLFRLRPPKPVDERILLVEIDEAYLQGLGKWPIPDAVMAQLLQKLNSLKPRAVGLDIYRNIPVPPGSSEFAKVTSSMPNLIGIEKLKDKESLGVPPSSILSQKKQIGFNNVVVDADGKVRRSLLYWHIDGTLHTSFALRLAFIYLNPQRITPSAATINPEYLQLGKAIFRRFESHDGPYVRGDDSGYQILANLNQIGKFRRVSMAEVLANKVSPELVRDRIILIGSTAPSLQDLFYTPYSNNLSEDAQPISGVELQANFLSQILTASLTGNSLFSIWTDPVENLWIFAWSFAGALICWRVRSSQTKATISILLAGIVLTGSTYLAFLNGWWIPLVPPMFALFGSAVMITSYLAHLEEELKRSKDFLQTVINTIADPIFVKDQEHRWIILNQAYCQFIGHPIEELINKSEYNIFSQKEAEVFWQQDELVFQSGKQQENEEEFTDSRGNTHLIETKRSLHKDAAGNLFLVGVIRDITERKRIEEELKRTAAELIRSNNELKVSEDRMRYLAYHDQLTGLPNRKKFYDSLNHSLEWANINNKLVGLLFLDLDGFKLVNDTLGHHMGDALLQLAAERLIGSLRGSDTVSRLGGDEFTVILPGIFKVQDAARVAEKILATLSEPFVIDNHRITVTVSIGISVYPLDTKEMDTLIKNADAAMYRAKESGRNQFHIHQN